MLASGSGEVKLVLDDGSGARLQPYPVLDPQIEAAIIAEAHSLGLQVYAHAPKYKFAKRFMEMGGDGLVHGISDEKVDAGFIALMKSRQAPYINTAALFESISDIPGFVRRQAAFDVSGVMTPEQWAEVVDTNLTGVFHTCRVAIPHMRRRGGGFIINISSLAGKNPFADGAAYCASKSGLNAFSEALMQEVRYDNIRVSYVMPGSVATAFSSGDENKGADWKIAPEEVAEVVVNLLRHNPRSLPSRVELRPSKPRK